MVVYLKRERRALPLGGGSAGAFMRQTGSADVRPLRFYAYDKPTMHILCELKFKYL